MKRHKKLCRLTATILLLAMLASTAAACGIVITPPDEPTIPTDPTNPTETPNPHVCVFSDWEVVKEVTSTEDGLRERRCECGKVEQDVIPASGKEYVIHYMNLKSAAYPEQTGYNSRDGLLELPVPEADGYTFAGWYTASVGGEIVDYIPKGSKEDYVLFAHWEVIAYDITYRNAPNHTNVTTYDIEDKLNLKTPSWNGLVFTHWSDEKGNIYKPTGNITILPEKMFGDLILTANWKTLRNIASPAADNAKLYSDFSTEDGYLFFYYHLGTIQHVVLDSKDALAGNLYYKSEGIPIEYTLSQTVTIGEETGKTITNTVSKSISQSQSTEQSMSFALESSRNWNEHLGTSVDASIGAEIGAGGAKITGSITTSIEESLDVGGSRGTSQGWNSSLSSSKEIGMEESESVSSSLAYMEEISTTKEETIYVGAEQPSGYYAYVHAGNIEVYATVIYDIETGNLFINTYSYLDNMHTMVMYYPDVASLNDPAVDSLDFTIPEEEIKNMIESAYYVKYDANGGEGRMPVTLCAAGGEVALAKNAFTKEGFVFAGWKLEKEDGNVSFADGEMVKDLAEPLHTVTLKAMWDEDPTYDKDVVYTAATKSGYVSKGVSGKDPDIKYSAVIEYRNRTANSVEIRVKFTSTITKGWYTVYGQRFNFSIGSNKSGTLEIVPFNTWKNISSANRSLTKTSAWMTVPLSTAAATTVSLKIYYWQVNSGGTDMTANYDYHGINTTWTVDIPAD